jgi:amino acid adenylation domain-containing protein
MEKAYREGNDFRRNAVPQYSEYAAFERKHGASRLFQKAISYWKDRLAIRARSVSLYGHLLEDARPTTNRSVVELGESRSTRIREVARNAMPGALTEDVGLFNIFMTALAAYLYRVSGQSHLRIGAPAHNRPRPDLKRTIGLFIEVLPFEVEIDEDETFDTLLQKVALETSRFLKLAQPGISSTRTNTSFNVLLNFIHASFPSFAGLQTETEWIHTGYGDAAHHLRLQVHDFDLDGGFSLHFDFNTDLLDNQEQVDAGQHFTRILDGLLEDRGRRISEVGLLTDELRARVLAFSEGDFEGTIGGTVPDLIASIANRNPDSCAVRDGAREITYGQLAEQSENVASALRQLGVKDGEYVGILVDRSTHLLPTILGALRAGAAYVPLDPADPAPRLSTIIEDSGVQVVLCTTGSAAHVSSQGQTVVDIHEAVNYSGPRADLLPLRPEAAAYVIYTSGSTGRPKGVVVTHGSLANYVGWARSTYAPDRAVSMPLYTSHSFDLTVTSLFLPLVTGGSVVVYSPDPGGPDTSILRVVNDDDVDVLKLTPSHFAILRDSVTTPKRIKTLIFGGEALRRDLAEEAMRVFGRDVAIFNEYGPTEATVGCMIHRFDPDRDVKSDVPIGHPIARTRVYLLDDGLEPVPPGVAGELMVGGAGVAVGYHGKQDLSAESFIESPFTPDDRLYRTGDLAVMDASGVIHYRGRKDRQLKVHGYRIERGEVEAALLAHPAVNDCVVTVVTNENTGDRVIQRCVRCGLGSDYPGTAFDDRGVCNTCTDYDGYRERALDFFGSMDDLHGILTRECARKTGQYDCLVLLRRSLSITGSFRRVRKRTSIASCATSE